MTFSLVSPISALHVQAHWRSALSHDHVCEFGCETLQKTLNIHHLISPTDEEDATLRNIWSQ